MTARLRVLPLHHRRADGLPDHYLVLDRVEDFPEIATEDLEAFTTKAVGGAALVFAFEVEIPAVDEPPVELEVAEIEVAEIEPAPAPSTTLVINLNVDTQQGIGGQIEAALKAYGRRS